jgi:hypothetical protein
MSNTAIQQPDGTSKLRIDLGSGYTGDAVVHAGKMAGERVTEDILATGRYLTTVSASYTRQADTTAYAAGDALCGGSAAVLTFAAAVRYNAGTGRIVGARIVDDSAPATAGDFELYLFSSSVTATTDNNAWSNTDAEMRNCIGCISFGSTPKVGGSAGNRFYQISEGAGGLPINFKAGAGLTDIYGVVVVRNAYTPANAGVLNFYLDIVQD